jgi:hypothetical protein
MEVTYGLASFKVYEGLFLPRHKLGGGKPRETLIKGEGLVKLGGCLLGFYEGHDTITPTRLCKKVGGFPINPRIIP